MLWRLCSALSLAWAAPWALAAGEVHVWTPPVTMRVLLEQPWPERLPPPRLSLDACRGEVEWGQVVVRADAPTRVQLRCSSWQTPAGGDDALPQLRPHRAHYVRVDFPSGNRVNRPASWPDPLPEGDVADLAPGRNQAFYLQVSVPPDCLPGLYQAQLSVLTHGTAVARVPVRLRVWDVPMPGVPRMRSSYYVWWEGLRRRYKLTGTAHELPALNRFFWFLIQHRICPMTLPVSILDRRAEQYMADPRVNAVRVPYSDRREDLEVLTAHLRRKGWLRRTYVYLYDEPARRDWDKVWGAAQLLQSVAPDLARLDSIQPEPELQGAVTIWCPNIEAAALYAHRIPARQAAGEEVWWYTCAVPTYPYPNLLLDDDGDGPRLLCWLQARLGVTGSLYINTIHWGPEGWDPWQRAVISMEGVRNNHDGLLMYSAGEGADCYPVTSVRLEALRDGMEDWELLQTLRETALEAGRRTGAFDAPALAERWVQGLASQVMPDVWHARRDPYRLQTTRLRVLETIVCLRRTPRAVLAPPVVVQPPPPGPVDRGKFLYCPAVEIPPQVDGDLSDGCWQQVRSVNGPGMRTVVTRLRNLTGRIWPSQNTVWLCCRNGGEVYLAADCQEPAVERMTLTGPPERADHVWLQLPGARRLMVTAAGEVVRSGDWRGIRARAAARRTQTGYQVEIALPLAAFKGESTGGTPAEALLNFGRLATPGSENLAWVSRFGPPQSPQQWGILRLRD